MPKFYFSAVNTIKSDHAFNSNPFKQPFSCQKTGGKSSEKSNFWTAKTQDNIAWHFGKISILMPNKNAVEGFEGVKIIASENGQNPQICGTATGVGDSKWIDIDFDRLTCKGN